MDVHAHQRAECGFVVFREVERGVFATTDDGLVWIEVGEGDEVVAEGGIEEVVAIAVGFDHWPVHVKASDGRIGFVREIRRHLLQLPQIAANDVLDGQCLLARIAVLEVGIVHQVGVGKTGGCEKCLLVVRDGCKLSEDFPDVGLEVRCGKKLVELVDVEANGDNLHLQVELAGGCELPQKARLGVLALDNDQRLGQNGGLRIRRHR